MLLRELLQVTGVKNDLVIYVHNGPHYTTLHGTPEKIARRYTEFINNFCVLSFNALGENVIRIDVTRNI